MGANKLSSTKSRVGTIVELGYDFGDTHSRSQFLRVLDLFLFPTRIKLKR